MIASIDKKKRMSAVKPEARKIDDGNKISEFNPYVVEMVDPKQFLVRNFENLVENQQWITLPAIDPKTGMTNPSDKTEHEAHFNILLNYGER